jgi:hypothetical protein
MAYRLGIDLGTTNTVASIAADGAPVQLVGLGARSHQMRSLLFLAEDGQFVVGDAAADRATSDPARLIIDPRRQLGTDVPMVIGGQEITAEEATTALISFVVSRATAQLQQRPSATVLSHPAHWDDDKVERLDRAISAANLGFVRTCTDAEAAVATYAAREALSNGQRVLVYDLGGGSCEVTVLEKRADGVRIFRSEGADHPSGADFDEAIFRLVLSNLGDRGRQLEHDDPDSRNQVTKIKSACTRAKEALSAAAEAQVPVSLPGHSTTIRMSRQEFVSLVRPGLRESIAMATRAIRGAGIQPDELAAIILVGGCCRMPIVAELLQHEFDGTPIALGTHPEYDVAIGTLLVSDGGDIAAAGAVPLPSIAAVAGAEAGQPAAESQPIADEAQQAVPNNTTVVTEAPEDSTVITEPTASARPDDHPPIPGPQPPAPTPEGTMPDHLIFDRFTSIESDADDPTHGQAAYAAAPAPPLPQWAQESAPQLSSGSVAAGSSPTPPAYGAQLASNAYPQGPQQPGSPVPRPGSYPSPGQYPPGQFPQGQFPQGPRGPVSPGARPPGYPYTPGSPPTQPYGTRGPGGPGGYPPGPGSEGQGPNGSRRRVILIIAGGVLVAAAVITGVLISRSGGPATTTASPPVVFPTPSIPPSVSPTPPTASPTPTSSAAGSASASASGGPTSSPVQKLPSSAAIPQTVVVVPMRFDSGPDRPLYLVDSEGKIKQVELPSPDGGNSNPIMQTSRDTIIYLNAGVLRVMAADGSGDRKLFNRDPAGCRRVEHASWSLADPNEILISCRVSKSKVNLRLVGMDGRLIRRLDTGTGIVGDATLSPDGQTVLYWASHDQNVDGGALYTLPIIGTGAPKRLTQSADGVDADPAWSPDGTQIAFRRTVPNGTLDGNEDVFVMNADGSGARDVASTPAADFKPIWSPDNKNLLIVSNRKSDSGGPGGSFDLWLTRVRDGEVLDNLGLKARQITRPFWTLR